MTPAHCCRDCLPQSDDPNAGADTQWLLAHPAHLNASQVQAQRADLRRGLCRDREGRLFEASPPRLLNTPATHTPPTRTMRRRRHRCWQHSSGVPQHIVVSGACIQDMTRCASKQRSGSSRTLPTCGRRHRHWWSSPQQKVRRHRPMRVGGRNCCSNDDTSVVKGTQGRLAVPPTTWRSVFGRHNSRCRRHHIRNRVACQGICSSRTDERSY